MRRISTAFSLAAALYGLPLFAAETGSDLLFRGVTSKLSSQDKSNIFRQLGLTVAANDRRFILAEFRECGSFDATVAIEDLNNDGTPEVVVTYGNSCTSGKTGSTVVLFVKTKSGTYQQNLGFPADGFTALPVTTKGFPDLAIQGPGFCRGIWRWNGSHYVHRCNEPEHEGACQFQGHVCRAR